ncbi:hypothetical protein ABZT06_48635 [Streptomyces sp. NPDC005483]|uniref:hypothetical protein n=1 Tax=Streptomyces sp. NPDC005483 TaxID=3154882 RepID=UPI0033A3924B
MATSRELSLCLARQDPRPANRTVPQDVVIRQFKQMLRSYPNLAAEGFDEVVFSDSLHRLLPYLKRLSEARAADLGLDGGDGLGDPLLVRRVFGPEIVPLWRRKPGSNLAGGTATLARTCRGCHVFDPLRNVFQGDREGTRRGGTCGGHATHRPHRPRAVDRARRLRHDDGRTHRS